MTFDPVRVADGFAWRWRIARRRYLSGRGARAALVATAAALVGATILAGQIGGVRAQDVFAGPHPPMMDRGDMQAFARWRLDRLLDKVEARPDQKTRIAAIMDRTFASGAAMHDQHETARESFVTLISAPTVDRAALEALRAHEIAAADEASRNLIQALADAADVLDAPQRAKLATILAQHHR